MLGKAFGASGPGVVQQDPRTGLPQDTGTFCTVRITPMPNETIETFDLVVFLAVARSGSFGAAAQELRLATPSVSARMATLERRVPAELFHRTARGSRLTPAGERFRTYARRCLDILEEAHHAVPVETREPVVVAAPASLGSAIFAPVLRVLNDAKIAGQARIADSNAVIDQILDGSADVGFVVNGVIPSTIVARRVCRSRIMVISSPTHELAKRRVSLHDLLGTRVAVYRWEAEVVALAEVFNHPKRPPDRSVQFLGLPSAVIQLVTSDDYIGVVPEFGVVDALRDGDVTEISLNLPTWSLDVHMVYRRDAPQRPGVDPLLESLSSLAAGMKVNPRLRPRAIVKPSRLRQS